MQFRTVFANGEVDRARQGDRMIYDRRNGTLALYRDSAELTFSTDSHIEPSARLFVGRDWSPDLTGATALLYARLGELDGQVVRIEGSFATLETWEVVA